MNEKTVGLNKKNLVTGAAGFIGAYLCMELLGRYPEAEIIGTDNLNDYYEVILKLSRFRNISEKASGIALMDVENGFSIGKFTFIKENLSDKANIE